ncbi:arabinan endo-1,5-alpha-L-arabinosidase [Adhaeribacter rhizoryzae]|uniref:Family 43 glycosylhydrolase n=1 Tax=Adhaeribacter rhizoryzae TaxID=2607907 RepID=A0A5M6D173_9BACT|nr:arabinan endo-1,5-alpha-L-arabinosidase [Adhaeribacter rhizoryzae]KAA5541247.1 family 43 glycosylhydrolase [Adhaeribacter rhizoryzae]
MKSLVKFYLYISAIGLSFSTISCKKDSDVNIKPQPPDPTPAVFDINAISDTYAELAPFNNVAQWGPYNVHDPAIIKSGEYFYCYSTDAAFGITVRPGIQVRKSKDLIQWEFVGWAFPDLPPQAANYIKQNGGTPFASLWAPYVIKVNNEYRLYYSLSSATPKLSAIGLATASSPAGPWTEKGLVVTSRDNIPMTNAIDPSVIVDAGGQHWMYYGSAWDGIYILKLDAATGLAAVPNAKGKRIAQRGSTGGQINGNIEGPEIIYNPELKKYYLFIAYDWLETKYNVRVGRADSPEGPFYDFAGQDINNEQDNGPMILAPYQFTGHGGWQGVSHPAVFQESGQFFMAHQGRPGVNKFFMVLHVREIFWTPDGWPVVSPERYAGVSQTPITQTELVGNWEQIVLGYRVVPGYANEQTIPDFQVAFPLKINADGTLNTDAGSTWKYQAPWLEMKWLNGFTDKVQVTRGRDWENKKPALIFTGLNNNGTAIWGKKTL